MNDILLAKPILGEGEIDWAVGESHLIKDNLNTYITPIEHLTKEFSLSSKDLEYPHPNGYAPLIELLENKYQAPVIITNGAKQALAASMYALKKHQCDTLHLQPIYWALLPNLAYAHGLDVEFTSPYNKERLKQRKGSEGYLLLSPNNPDGWSPSYEQLHLLSEWFKEQGIPLIHDGAYYTHSFLPEDYQLGPIGDIQIFSFSKMLGLSGLRLGAIVLHDKSYYHDVVEYMEMMTVGVSVASQKILHSILQRMESNPTSTKIFEKANYTALTQAKKMLREIAPVIVDVPKDIEQSGGMFAWLKLLDREVFKRAKIHIVNGDAFGDDKMIRLNLAIGKEKMEECIKRLNEAI